MTESRRGSVTSLLQAAADLYSPPSPSHIPNPQPDCWDDTSRGLRHEREKLAASTRLSKPTPPLYQKSRHKGATAPEGEGAHVALRSLPSTSKKVDGEDKSGKEKAKTGGRVKLSTGQKPEAGVKGRGTPADKTAQRGSKMGGGDRPGRGRQRPAGALQDKQNRVLAPDKSQPRVMVGCSGAYQEAVRAVRGSTPDKSVVLLGVTEDQQAPSPLQTSPKFSKPINTCSFTVAMAATKLMSLGLRRSVTDRLVTSAGPHDDDTNDLNSLTPSTSILATRKTDRSRGGKKLFEDAYVVTWSQSILPADQSDFNITFDKPRKTRVVRVGKLRRRSTTADVIPPPDPEDQDKEAAEWLAWRRTHDRVLEWLKGNAQVEADESHVIAMLLDPDPKKGALYRT